MTRVALPPGCAGFRRTSDGKKIDGRNGYVTLEGTDDKAIRKSQHRSIGLVTPETWTIGTKRGKWCAVCARLWQAWSASCPRCGANTEDC